ncbi:hypothetical protein SHAb15599_00193 [Acinetobacter phage SH-Ab 15599]|nr:hypothetical protein SHAb15599_00193 [Acinetobacter phage SH-Ab 15599]
MITIPNPLYSGINSDMMTIQKYTPRPEQWVEGTIFYLSGFDGRTICIDEDIEKRPYTYSALHHMTHVIAERLNKIPNIENMKSKDVHTIIRDLVSVILRRNCKTIYESSLELVLEKYK